MSREQSLRRRIQWLTLFFIAGLFLGGATAIPLQVEVNLLTNLFGPNTGSSEISQWLLCVHNSLAQATRSMKDGKRSMLNAPILQGQQNLTGLRCVLKFKDSRSVHRV